jgi:DNA (cytosine-5)-methyltransferase 1
MKHLGDITKISGYTAPVVDCIIGGSPCQDLSVAGKRAGLDGERSGLYMEQIRIVKEMRERDERNGRTGVDIRPRYMVWENVPGAFSSNKGEDFRVVIEELAKVKDKNVVIPMPDKGKWANHGCVVGDGWSIAWRVLDAQFWGVPQRRRRIALIADFGGQSAPEILFVRQSVSGDIDESKPKRKATSTDAERSVGTNDREGEVTSYSIAVVYALDRASFNQGKNAQYDFEVSDKGINSSLVAKGPSAVCYGFDPSATRDVGQYFLEEKGNVLVNGSCPGHHNGVCIKIGTRYIVRRLTPLECERLQGYPDGWTDIGEWTDTNGKKRQTSDAARYKALGNSIALPPWKWVLKRLCACYERDATMASLFDGIGGFPYLWEQLNGKGTCLWASEIEEFPIAVTKVRIGEDK